MINGKILRDAFISGANSIANSRVTVDELNVFPVPDGDTGTNMSMTMANALADLSNMEDSCRVSAVADVAASAFLRGARGNSGVILSLIFRGFKTAFKDKNAVGAKELANALRIGVDGAYQSIMKPTEGTILTVARVAAECAEKLALQTDDVVLVFSEAVKAAEQALEKTPEQLPALKKAGVVDAGGKGLVIILRAMLEVISGGEIVKAESTDKPKITTENFSTAVGDFDEIINFTYCTEMLIKKDPDCRDSKTLRAYLETIGDCVVVVEDEEIIKVHVHTNNPGKAIEKALTFGSINLPKIENMQLQHDGKKKSKKNSITPVKPEKEYGFVAVAAGFGLEAVFKDTGVDIVVSGGQTMNPSTDDILYAIVSCPAETVFVLPNNKNIIMAAEQAAKLADRRVCVLQTRTIPQGMSAMLGFDPNADFNTNRTEMTKAFSNVSTGLVTFAARDSDFDNHKIHQGDILALDEGKLTFVEDDIQKAAYKLTKKLVRSDSQYITVIYGADVTEDDAEKLHHQLEAKYQNLEVALINGGQPVYYYIISVE
ncbi:MAG: DAK2 domain-containing protein [Ruminococcus sp.]|nr:DAK2 domain-containing protein [Ruminococcus sp.]